MKHRLLVILLVVAFHGVVAAQRAGVQRVAWLQGCWAVVSPERTIEEHWMVPRGKSMVGVGRTVRGDTLVEYELVLIREQGDQLAYEAHPAGQPAAVFLSREVTDSSVLFENLQHDFPQRIGYSRRGADMLLAWVEGTQQGQVRRIEFPYRRAVCPAG
jgi:uncharacterized protein DUF6265